MIVNLSTGDSIEYTRKLDRSRTKNCKGIVIQATDKHITVDLGKYRDSFQLCDIGKDVEITFPENVITIPKEDSEMKPKDPNNYPEVSTDELKQIWADCNFKVSRVASHFGIKWIFAEKLLTKHNLLDEVPKHEGYPVMISGHIDWDVMWPLCKVELDKGTDKDDVAEMFNLPYSTLDARIKRVKRWERKAEKLNVPKLEPKPEPITEPPAENIEAVEQEPKIICSRCGREIDTKNEIYAENNGQPLCFDCIREKLPPEDVLSAEIEVTEDKPQLEEVSCYRRLMFEPEELHTLKAELTHELKLLTDSLEMLDLCLYWYDRGRQDGIKEE